MTKTEVKNMWAVINGFLNWDEFIVKHKAMTGSIYLPETIANELIEIALGI